MTTSLDLFVSILLTLALHSTVLLAVVWLLERSGALRHAGWLELAWRGALLGALCSTAIRFAPLDGASFVQSPAREISATPTTTSRNDVRPQLLPTHVSRVAGVQAPRPVTAPRRGTSAATRTHTIPRDAAIALLAAWCAGILCTALALLRQALALRRMRAHVIATAAAPQAATRAAVHTLANGFAITAPRISVDTGIASPMLLSQRHLLLPRWADVLDTRRQHALLAHEFAHLQRRDPCWRLLHRLALLPLCFHPLAWHARCRLDALAEDACDARAAAWLGDGRALAECLAACLEHAPARRANTLAVAMANTHRGAVARRVHTLLQELPMRSLSPLQRRLALAVGLAALVLLPGLAVSTAVHGGHSTRIHIGMDDGNNTVTYSSSRPGYALDVAMDGKIEFAIDESDVTRMDDDAELDIEETVDDVTRQMTFRVVGGQVERRYRLDGKAHALDADAHAWLARTLPALFRETGIDAEARSARILARGGTEALFVEIDQISNDGARRMYLEQLFRRVTLDDAQVQRALEQAAQIGSDFELRNTLQAAFETQTLSDEARRGVLRAATSIESDFERAELLSLACDTPMQGETLAAWNTAREGIASDFEQRRVLNALLQTQGKDAAVLALALAAVQQIDGDFEARELLVSLAPQVRGSDALMAQYLRSVDTLDGDFEHSTALLAILDGAALDAATANAILSSVERMGGAFEVARVMMALAPAMPADAALVARYRQISARLGEFERQQADAALGRSVKVY